VRFNQRQQISGWKKALGWGITGGGALLGAGIVGGLAMLVIGAAFPPTILGAIGAWALLTVAVGVGGGGVGWASKVGIAEEYGLLSEPDPNKHANKARSKNSPAANTADFSGPAAKAQAKLAPRFLRAMAGPLSRKKHDNPKQSAQAAPRNS